MYEKPRNVSNIGDISSIFLTASLAIAGFGRPSAASERPEPNSPVRASEYLPHASEISELPTAREREFTTFDSYQDLMRNSDRIHALAFFQDFRDRFTEILKDLIEEDKSDFGVTYIIREHQKLKQAYVVKAGEDLPPPTTAEQTERREAIVERLRKISKDYEHARIAVGAVLGTDSPFLLSDLPDNTSSLIQILTRQVASDWDRSSVQAGELSAGGKLVARLLENYEKAKDSPDILRRSRSLDGRQPQLSLVLPLAQANSKSARGTFSCSSDRFIAANLPNSGFDYVMLAPNLIEYPNQHNWRGFLYVLGGANKAGQMIERVEIDYPATEVFVRIDDNCLLKIVQRGSDLSFSKNSSGYAQSSTGGELLGFGGSRVVPLANIYATVNPLEALAYIDNDWRRIYNDALGLQRSNRATVDPALIEHLLRPLATDMYPEIVTAAGRVVVISDGTDAYQPPAHAVPVYIRLKDSTLLRIEEEGTSLRFATTAAGYAVAGGSVSLREVKVQKEIAVSDIYTEVSSSQALGYFDNDWRPIYNAVVRQARIIPHSVFPPLVLAELNPKASLPRIEAYEFKNSDE